jgi:hypothetical protein
VAAERSTPDALGGRRVVHHDDGALSQRRDQPALNIDPEALAIDWPVEHPWRIDAVARRAARNVMVFPCP